MGATDVCPLIPIANITMGETVEWAQRLAERVGRELSLPVYLYEEAQADKTRSNLSVIRAGEYEGFFKKINELKPDFGPAVFDAKRGATVIGARDFLVAYNVNLNTTSVRRANAIAFDIREAGRKMTDDSGKMIIVPGSLKSVKAIGWYIEEYGIAQISINLTNINITPVHIAFDEVCKKADARGIRVTGSELVGLIPLQAMLDAGKYFLRKQKRSTGVSEKELIRIAVISMGLDELSPFKSEEKIIEKLKTTELSKALESGFDFSKMKKGTITTQVTGDNPFLKKYLGYNCESLLRKIHHHIGQMKLLPELYDLKEDKKINVKTRLENLGKRYILFSKFLTSK